MLCNSDMIANETIDAARRAAAAVRAPSPEPVHHRRLFYMANRVRTHAYHAGIALHMI